MKPFDKLLFPLLGAAFWVAGTIAYEFRGHHILETSSTRYWINFMAAPVVTTLLCAWILRWRQVAASEWAGASLLIALPGMFGEALLLSRFAVLMPRMRPESAGKYAAFLFATYGLFLALAEIVTLRAD
jgi:Family of unknown function (DUF5367)